MFSSSTDVYDLIYRFKDYAAEAAQLAQLIERERPGARTLLDVACGTGEHIRQLGKIGNYQLTGIDIEPEFISAAQAKVPDAHFVCADMMTFDLQSQFDVVLSLFSAIGYARTIENLRETIHRMRDHLAPEGIIIVEPWFTPDAWNVGMLSVISERDGDLQVARMTRSDARGRISTIECEYLIGRPSGIETRSELHELGLFTREEMTECFERAGLAVRYDDVGLMGRGLYIAKASGG